MFLLHMPFYAVFMKDFLYNNINPYIFLHLHTLEVKQIIKQNIKIVLEFSRSYFRVLNFSHLQFFIYTLSGKNVCTLTTVIVQSVGSSFIFLTILK